MIYDDWKSTPPDPPPDIKQCHVCGSKFTYLDEAEQRCSSCGVAYEYDWLEGWRPAT